MTQHMDDWYRRGIFYELHVRSFSDSNGDGIGDFPGLISKLDYLQELGVTAVWLLPFYPSPLRDEGYDTADYRRIHPDYGDMRSFRRFLREAHRRDIKVITELVINHTSDQHAWFQRARKAPAGSAARDYYVWSDTTDKYEEARIIFSDFENSNWTWDPVAGAYFWHRFYSHQPDLNFDNPAVRKEVMDLLDFWMEIGVDGMRLDAVPYLFEREGTNCENLPETHAFLKELRAHVDEHFPGRMFLAEANQWPEDAAAYFGDGDECQMNFHFPLMPRLFMAVQAENRLPIEDILEQTPVPPAGSQWATFLRNHDELTLEMVTDEERDYLWRSYANDPQMRINLGIRRRLAPLLGNDRRKIELLNSILFSLPGTPVVYYGDEIGLGDNVYLGDRSGVRTPMQWSPDRNAGFSKASPQRLFLPPITEPGYHYENINVEAQAGNPSSLLWWMRQLIALRRRNRVLGEGDVQFLDHRNGRVLAYLRTLDGEPPVLCVANLSRHAQSVELELGDHNGSTPVEMFGHVPFAPIGELPYYITLGPHGFLWFVLEPSPEAVAPEDKRPLAVVSTAWAKPESWNGDQLTGALATFMAPRRWFGGKDKRQRTITVSAGVSIDRVRLMRVDLDHTDGSSESYNVPVTVVRGERAMDIQRLRPEGVIARIEGSPDALLVDAMVDETSVLALARAAMSRRLRSGDGADLVGEPVSKRVDLGPKSADDDHQVRFLSSEQSNSSALILGHAVFKLIRRIGPGINPDLEIGRHLDGRGDREIAAPMLGALTLRSQRSEATVALLSGLVDNEGDAWEWALGELGRYLEQAMAGHFGIDTPIEQLDSLAMSIQGTREPFALLGRRTAQLHQVLCGEPGTPFEPETYNAHYQRALYQSLRGQAKATLMELRGVAATSGASSADTSSANRETAMLIEQILADSDVLLATFERLRRGRIRAERIRIHGDLHLGQVLWTGRDFIFIDFEGEPARPISERRIKRSPLVDVAGLIRSIDYVAAVAIEDLSERGWLTETDRPDAVNEAHRWRDAMTDALVGAYLEQARADGLLPDDDADTIELLRVFGIEKALYEVRYELQSRPHWARHPLAAVTAMIDDAEREASR